MPDKDIDKIPITVEVPKADVWVRNDYRDIVRRLGEVHMIRASGHQHDDDFVPLYDIEMVFSLKEEIERLRDCISAREVRSLVDERDRLRAERDSFYMDYRIKCDEETKRQAVEIERLRADAERYRFLRTGRHWPCVFADYDDPEPLCELELDIAIDTAMVPDSVVDKAWQRFEQAVQQPAAEVANPFAKLNKEGK